MAKVSAIKKTLRKKELAEKHRHVRTELRKIMADPKVSDEEKWEAQIRLQKLPRDGSICRVTNRCYVTGRPRGFLRKFGLSRIAFREMASRGLIPGVTKSSW